VKIRLFILAVIFLLLGLFPWRDVLQELVICIMEREGSSHGLFVPFITAYFIWVKRNKIRKAPLHFSAVKGGLLIIAGIVLFIISKENQEIALPGLSFLFVIAGSLITLLGWSLFKELAFSIFFLATMLPLPQPIYSDVAKWMKELTTFACVSLLHLFHFPIYRDGFNIFLPNTTLVVGDSCSGIRYLLSFTVFSFAYAYLFKKSITARVLVVITALPISLLGGILRLSTIFISAYFIGPFMAEHRPHILLSWAVFITLLFGAIGIDSYLSKKVGDASLQATH